MLCKLLLRQVTRRHTPVGHPESFRDKFRKTERIIILCLHHGARGVYNGSGRTQMVSVIVEPVAALPPANHGAVGAEDVSVHQRTAVVDSQHFAEGSAHIVYISAALAGSVAKACPTPGVMIVFITIRYAAFRNAERQVAPVVRGGRKVIAAADRGGVSIGIVAKAKYLLFSPVEHLFETVCPAVKTLVQI